MRIENLVTETKDKTKRVSASIFWENCNREPYHMYFEVQKEYSEHLWCNPNSFLLAAVIPAFHFGEKRVKIDGEVCPELIDGLKTAMLWIRKWRDIEWELPRLEYDRYEIGSKSSKKPRTGYFFSGGIDSLGVLRENRLNYPIDHIGAIKEGIVVYNLEIYRESSFAYLLKALEEIAADAKIDVVKINTNMRFLVDNWEFWEHEWEGAAFAAIAHSLSKRYTSVCISSTFDIRTMRPLGSHPLVDPYYSSSDLRIRHEGIKLSRFEKTRLISEWDVALNKLRVCNRDELYGPGRLNCGECEKCMRTMLALLSLGKLKDSTAFPYDDVTEEMALVSVKIASVTVCFYKELIEPLSDAGRNDLARIIKRKIEDFYSPNWKKQTKKVIVDSARSLDRKIFNNALKRNKIIRKIKNTVYPHYN